MSEHQVKLALIAANASARKDWQGVQKKEQENVGQIIKVTGHPWIKVMRDTPSWQWDLAQCNDMLVFPFFGGPNVVGTMQEHPDIWARPLAGPTWTVHPDGHLMKGPYEPVHPHDGKQMGIGPMRAFSRRFLQRRAGDGVVVVPCGCGWGDMSIKAWEPEGPLYRLGMQRAKMVAQAVSGRIAGIYWHNGEADATKEEDAKLYYRRLSALFKKFRQDVGDPTLPIIAGEIGERFLPREIFKYARDINSATRRVGKRKHTAVIAAPAGHHKNMIHFDAHAQEEFGCRAADMWDRMWTDLQRVEKRVAPDGSVHSRKSWAETFGSLVQTGFPKKSWAFAKPFFGDREVEEEPDDEEDDDGSRGRGRGSSRGRGGRDSSRGRGRDDRRRDVSRGRGRRDDSRGRRRGDSRDRRRDDSRDRRRGDSRDRRRDDSRDRRRGRDDDRHRRRDSRSRSGRKRSRSGGRRGRSGSGNRRRSRSRGRR
eukprot:TRINITY_DN26584_c0_g1_i1.p2 TRINITY_DN26584_c0_g1~~TRINITY_DN26584_c0_g1_i1.p2  ORF type:complete len:479 (+),score=149.09 TRINITY_DN26584_c0_g1_i1:66-1502(+)